MRKRRREGNPGEFVVASHGMLSYGFPESSIETVIRENVDLIAVDAGSTDPGPYYLGSGKMFGDREMTYRDIALLLQAQEATGAKMVIGSAGGAGTDEQVDQTLEILREEVARLGLKRSVAIVRSELSKDEVRAGLRSGRVTTFETMADLTEVDIEASTHIVAQIGVEPIVAALKQEPDIVLCGRAWDPANIAALPILQGYDSGLSIHAGKILECGSLAVSPPQGADMIIGRIRPDHFIIEPCSINQQCTIESVSAHTFYEKTDPQHLPGPGGWSDLRQTTFHQIDERRVSVAGSRFVRDAVHRVKLEGAKFSGWRNVMIAGIRDPIMISRIDAIQRGALERLALLLAPRIARNQYTVTFRRYGIDGVMGALEPVKAATHEIGLVIEVVAETDQLAATVMATLRSLLLHWPYEGRIATAGNLALPFSPAEFSGGPVYEFSIYHLLDIDNVERRFSSEIVHLS